MTAKYRTLTREQTARYRSTDLTDKPMIVVVKENGPAIAAAIKQIRESLDGITEHIAWIIRADQRFAAGDKVEFSRKARRSRIVPKTRIDRLGTVKSVTNSFGVVVQIDGYKRPRTMHHAFFNLVGGPRPF